MRDAELVPIWALRTPFLPTLAARLGIRLPGRWQRLLNYALLPPQLLVPGDCLNVVARRPVTATGPGAAPLDQAVASATDEAPPRRPIDPRRAVASRMMSGVTSITSAT
jgi:hypothetical protein